MAEIGRSIVKMDVDELINLLNKALADEWLAYYQYWIGAKVVKGPMKDAVISELDLHATEELTHAQLLVTRIVQLGGTPLLTPEDWFKMMDNTNEKIRIDLAARLIKSAGIEKRENVSLGI